jgi:hypothetical protein
VSDPRIFFSPTRKGFFPEALRADYEASGSWPEDAIEVSDEVWTAHVGGHPVGKTLGAGENGQPAWVDLPPPSADDQLAALALLRWQKETSGIYFKAASAATASLYATDRESQSKIIGAAFLASAGALPSVTWKTQDGFFVPLTSADLTGLVGTAAAYVQACYAREGELAALIRAGQTPDISAGWPSRGSP